MDENTSHKKRIAKNTAFLYLRMLVVMGVTFFTSRVILHALGETDFGIYDVVGGVVTSISFLNSSLAAATSRFLTYELGRNNTTALANTFAASLNLHLIVAALMVLLGETVGVWFLENKMNIPESQRVSAFWILQFSIITTCFNFTQIPYNASIISHENMSVFAYVGLYEAFSKLGIAYLIQLYGEGRLILYGAMIMMNTILVRIFYRLYTRRHYPECRFKLVKNMSLYKKLLGYSGWDMFGNLAVICQNQGVNIVLNIFFGPVVNAARAIAIQIQGGLKAFVTSFLTAVRPRVVKLFAEEKFDSMYRLTFYACKIGYFLMFMLILPVAFEMKFILHKWLGHDVPPYTAVFAWIVLAGALVDTFHSAYLMSYHAVGKIREGNLICGSLMILSLPLGYMVLKAGLPPYSIFIVLVVVNCVCHIISWIILYRICPFNVGKLIGNVYTRCLAVSIIALIVPVVIVWNMIDGWKRFFTLVIMSELIYFLAVYFIGFSESERKTLIAPVFNKICSRFKT